MTTDDDPAPHGAGRPHLPLPVWIALAIAAVLALTSLAAILHHPGVPTLVPGHRGAGRMSS